MAENAETPMSDPKQLQKGGFDKILAYSFVVLALVFCLFITGIFQRASPVVEIQEKAANGEILPSPERLTSSFCGDPSNSCRAAAMVTALLAYQDNLPQSVIRNGDNKVILNAGPFRVSTDPIRYHLGVYAENSGHINVLEDAGNPVRVAAVDLYYEPDVFLHGVYEGPVFDGTIDWGKNGEIADAFYTAVSDVYAQQRRHQQNQAESVRTTLSR